MTFACLASLLFTFCSIVDVEDEATTITGSTSITRKENVIENCIAYIPNAPLCKTCDSGTGPQYPDLSMCLPCPEGYSGFNCADLMCKKLLSNCLECDSSGLTCKTCALGSYRVGTKCTECNGGRFGVNCEDLFCQSNLVKYCSKCDIKQPKLCAECFEDYDLDSSGLQCWPCPAGTGGIRCQRRECDGFFSHNCAVCGPRDSGFCRRCNDDYILDVYTQEFLDGVLVGLGFCKPCPPERSGPNCIILSCSGIMYENCLECSGKKCSVCSSGFVPNSAGQCEKCGDGLSGVNCVVRTCGFNTFDNCQECDQTDINACKTCRDGYYQDYTLDNIHYKSCLKCLPNCARCTSPNKCDGCLSNYQGEDCFTRKCGTTLHKYCTKCGVLNNKNKCVSCTNGAELSGGTCVVNECNVLNCKACEKGDASTCVECDEYYYLNNASCVPCNQILGCRSCTQTGVCLQCVRNAAPISLGDGNGVSCVFCGSITLGCTTCIGETRRCTDCESGMLLYNGSCMACQSHCLRCLVDGRCLGCEAGYYVSVDQVCLKCMDHCEVCSSAETCGTCELGYYLFEKDGQISCETCLVSCASCQLDSNRVPICTSCVPGYFLTGEMACEACLPNCKFCTQQYHCSECEPGFYLAINRSSVPTSMVCLECGANCNLCTLEVIDAEPVCKKAAPGYYISADNSIEPCIPNCIKCDDGTRCNLAKDGYYYDSVASIVKHCTMGCDLCTESLKNPGVSTCYLCSSNYTTAKDGNVYTCVLLKKTMSASTIAGIVIGILIAIAILVATVLLIRLRKKLDMEEKLQAKIEGESLVSPV